MEVCASVRASATESHWEETARTIEAPFGRNVDKRKLPSNFEHNRLRNKVDMEQWQKTVKTVKFRSLTLKFRVTDIDDLVESSISQTFLSRDKLKKFHCFAMAA